MKRTFTIAATGTLAMLAVFSACQKKSGVPGTAPNPETARTFDAVAKHLDPGGDIYVYLRTEQILAEIPSAMDEWKSSLETAFGAQTPISKDEMNAYYAVLRKAVVESGVPQLRAYGFSSVELPNGLSRMRSMVYTGALEKPGVLWRLSGSAGAHPLTSLDFVPADAVYAGFADMDLEVGWNYLMDIANDIPDPAVKQKVKALPALTEMMLGMSVKDLFASLGSEWGIVITADPTKTMSMPVGPAPVEIPLTRAALLLAVNDDKLYDLLADRAELAIGKMIPLAHTDAEGVKMTATKTPLMGLPLTPTIARFGKYLVIATSPEIVQTLARKGPNPPALMKDTEEFKQLSNGEKLEGNGYAFLSERGTKIVRTLQLETGEMKTMPPATKAQIEKLYDVFSQRSLFSIARLEKDGITSTMYSPDGSKKLMAIIAIVPLTAVAIAIPTMITAAEKAKALSSPPAPTPEPAPISPDPAAPDQTPIPPQAP